MEKQKEERKNNQKKTKGENKQEEKQGNLNAYVIMLCLIGQFLFGKKIT